MDKQIDSTGRNKREWEDSLVFDSRGLCVAMAPDSRGTMALIHTWSWRWRIHPETFDVAAEKRKNYFHKSNIFPWDNHYCRIFAAHTWGAPGSCGPGCDGGFLWDQAPEAWEEASLAESLQSAHCSSSQHTEEATDKESVQSLCTSLIYKTILGGSSFISECLKNVLNNCY